MMLACAVSACSHHLDEVSVDEDKVAFPTSRPTPKEAEATMVLLSARESDACPAGVKGFEIASCGVTPVSESENFVATAKHCGTDKDAMRLVVDPAEARKRLPERRLDACRSAEERDQILKPGPGVLTVKSVHVAEQGDLALLHIPELPKSVPALPLCDMALLTPRSEMLIVGPGTVDCFDSKGQYQKPTKYGFGKALLRPHYETTPKFGPTERFDHFGPALTCNGDSGAGLLTYQNNALHWCGVAARHSTSSEPRPMLIGATLQTAAICQLFIETFSPESPEGKRAKAVCEPTFAAHQGCYIEQKECTRLATLPDRKHEGKGRFRTSIDAAHTDKDACLSQAQATADWCMNPEGSKTKACFWGPKGKEECRVYSSP